MAFAVASGKGKARGPQPSMNVTPLVDVVLVLLIIFMVITPLLAKQFWLHVPVKEDPEDPPPPPTDDVPLVLTVRAGGGLEINRQGVDDAQLATRLPRLFAGAGRYVLFFEAEDGVPFGRAMEVLDRARAAGAVTIAVLPTAPRPL
jgi:biopolymer transport protein ExbD